jgi:hypothetical protein
MAADGVVAVCGAEGRLACAVIATSGFADGRFAAFIVGAPLSEPMMRKSRGNSEEGYNDDRTGN